MDATSLFSTGEPGLDGRLRNRPKDQAHRRREQRLKRKEKTQLHLVKKLDRTVISLRAENCTLDPLDTKTTWEDYNLANKQDASKGKKKGKRDLIKRPHLQHM